MKKGAEILLILRGVSHPRRERPHHANEVWLFICIEYTFSVSHRICFSLFVFVVFYFIFSSLNKHRKMSPSDNNLSNNLDTKVITAEPATTINNKCTEKKDDAKNPRSEPKTTAMNSSALTMIYFHRIHVGGPKTNSERHQYKRCKIIVMILWLFFRCGRWCWCCRRLLFILGSVIRFPTTWEITTLSLYIVIHCASFPRIRFGFYALRMNGGSRNEE